METFKKNGIKEVSFKIYVKIPKELLNANCSNHQESVIIIVNPKTGRVLKSLCGYCHREIKVTTEFYESIENKEMRLMSLYTKRPYEISCELTDFEFTSSEKSRNTCIIPEIPGISCNMGVGGGSYNIVSYKFNCFNDNIIFGKEIPNHKRLFKINYNNELN